MVQVWQRIARCVGVVLCPNARAGIARVKGRCVVAVVAQRAVWTRGRGTRAELTHVLGRAERRWALNVGARGERIVPRCHVEDLQRVEVE